jgi:hypothetical protein
MEMEKNQREMDAVGRERDVDARELDHLMEQVVVLRGEHDAAVGDWSEASDPTFMETAGDQGGAPSLRTAATQVLNTMERNAQRGGNSNQYTTQLINDMAAISREFEVTGHRVAGLFHAVLAMFTGMTREEASTMAQLPSKSSMYMHQKLVAHTDKLAMVGWYNLKPTLIQCLCRGESVGWGLGAGCGLAGVWVGYSTAAARFQLLKLVLPL